MSDSEESDFDPESEVSEESDFEAEEEKPKKKGNGKKKRDDADGGGGDDDDFDFHGSDDEVKKKKKTKKDEKEKQPKKAATTKRTKRKKEDIDADDSDESDKEKPKKKKKSKGKESDESVDSTKEKAAAETTTTEAGKEPSKPQSPKKELKGKTVEELYQKLTQVEHVLKRPDTYIGSVEKQEQEMWVIDENGNLKQRTISFVPGLYKIFDEILVNASDNKQRDATMDKIAVRIDVEHCEIEVWNNGSGIPVEMHKKEGCYVPELIFGHLLTGSNYSDDVKKVTGGRNGYGAKLANIFSTAFTIETADGKHSYKQTWDTNMATCNPPKIKDSSENYTCVTFHPDLKRFGMTALDNDIVALMRKRVYDIAGCNTGLRVFLNKKRIPIKSFKEYVALYVHPPEQSTTTSTSTTPNLEGDANNYVSASAAVAVAPSGAETLGVSVGQFVFEALGERWEVAVAVSDGQFQQVSFVNSICTLRGGTHVTLVADMIVKFLMEKMSKKSKKESSIKPFAIRNHLWLFVNSLIENPAFDSQTKETLTTKASSFGSKPEMTEGFLKKVHKLGITSAVLAWVNAKDEAALKRKGGARRGRIQGLVKLNDANNAGTKRSRDCTLILTEGDSAASLALSGLTVVGRDNYGVFPLRGKVLNVRDSTLKQVMDNEELEHICKAMGLKYGQVYANTNSLRYGHLMVMADQDFDGSHIKGLVINFMHKFWPSLVRFPGFLTEFITPIIKATKGKQEISFFTVPQFEEWKKTTPQAGWKTKYYKGLGTSTSAEGKEYFSHIDRHKIDFAHHGKEDDEAIDLAFNKKKADERKAWMRAVEPGTFLDQDVDAITISDFVNRELVLFSLADCERSIPCAIDGLKPGQRKILYVCFKKNMSKHEIKVCEMSGIVSSLSAYHHGEVSLHETIVGMAQNFVGSNNINTLYPSGQFGSRRQGGKDHASARYIHTRLSDITRKIFHADDDAVLDYLNEDGKSIEPHWYMPIIPMALVNGCEGIGTGWSTSIPCYNPRDIIANIKKLLKGESITPTTTTVETSETAAATTTTNTKLASTMVPWYRGWNGRLERDEKTKNFRTYGVWKRLSSTQIEITELPLQVWTQQYKEFLESLTTTTEKRSEIIVKDFKEYHGEETVHFVVDLMKEIPDEEIMKTFKLSGTLSVSNMVAFDEEGRITLFKTPEEIIEKFFNLRFTYYQKRKDYLLSVLEEQFKLLDNKARFIKAVIEKKLKIRNRKRSEVLTDLIKQKFDPISKSAKSAKGNKKEGKEANESDEESGNEEEGGNDPITAKSDFDYLLNMPLWSITAERAEKLIKELEAKRKEIDALKATTIQQLYERDLDELSNSIDAWEKAEEAELRRGDKEKKTKVVSSRTKGKKGGAGSSKKKKGDGDDFEEDEDDDFEEKKPKQARKKKEDPKSKPIVPAMIVVQPPTKPIATVTEPKKEEPKKKEEEEKKSTKKPTTTTTAAEPKKRKKRAKDSDDESEELKESDGGEESEEDLAQRLKKRSANVRDNISKMEESVSPLPSVVRPKRAAATARRIIIDDSDDDEDQDEEMMKDEKPKKKGEEEEKKKKPVSPVSSVTITPTPVVVAPVKKQEIVEIKDDSDKEEKKKKKQPQPQPKPTTTARKPKLRVVDSDDEEDDGSSDENDMKDAKPKGTTSDDGTARRSGRATRAKINYAEMVSDGEDDDDDDDE